MYSIVSGVVTFWLPAVVMVYVYIRYIVSQEILKSEIQYLLEFTWRQSSLSLFRMEVSREWQIFR